MAYLVAQTLLLPKSETEGAEPLARMLSKPVWSADFPDTLPVTAVTKEYKSKKIQEATLLHVRGKISAAEQKARIDAIVYLPLQEGTAPCGRSNARLVSGQNSTVPEAEPKPGSTELQPEGPVGPVDAPFLKPHKPEKKRKASTSNSSQVARLDTGHDSDAETEYSMMSELARTGVERTYPSILAAMPPCHGAAQAEDASDDGTWVTVGHRGKPEPVTRAPFTPAEQTSEHSTPASAHGPPGNPKGKPLSPEERQRRKAKRGIPSFAHEKVEGHDPAAAGAEADATPGGGHADDGSDD